MLKTLSEWVKAMKGSLLLILLFLNIIVVGTCTYLYNPLLIDNKEKIEKKEEMENHRENNLTDEFILEVFEENQKLEEEIKFLEKESRGLRRQLADYLERIERMEPKEAVTTTDDGRNIAISKISGPTMPAKKVLVEGKNISFVQTYNDPDWKRPTFHKGWYSTYFRFASIEHKMRMAYHRLFEVPPGASSQYDFFGLLGYEEKASKRKHKAVNPGYDLHLMVFQADIREVKFLGHQIVIVAEPRRTGAQRISLKRKDLLPPDKKEVMLLVQLVTPDGYEIDYGVIYNFSRSSESR